MNYSEILHFLIIYGSVTINIIIIDQWYDKLHEKGKSIFNPSHFFGLSIIGPVILAMFKYYDIYDNSGFSKYAAFILCNAIFYLYKAYQKYQAKQ